MNNLISVIIPAYNAASRLRPCLESVIAQDYDNIEIIFVDDFSSDDTLRIASEILQSSKRNFTILTNERNKGVSASRNRGILSAKGKYICFVDADDFVRENFVSSLHETVTQNDCQVSFCGYVDNFCDGRPDVEIISADCEPRVLNGEDIILRKYLLPLWCCMYDADFLRKFGIKFLEGCNSGEDVDFVTRVMCRAERVSFVDEFLYVYVHHAEMGSLRGNDTRDKKISRYEHNTNAQRSTAEYIAEHAKSKALKDMAGRVLMPYASIREITLSVMKDDRASYKTLTHNEKNVKILRRALSFFTLKEAPEIFVKALLILFFPGIYFIIRKIQGI